MATEGRGQEVRDSASAQYEARYGSRLGSMLFDIAVCKMLNEFGRGGPSGCLQRSRLIERKNGMLRDTLVAIALGEGAWLAEDKKGAATLVVEHITGTPRDIDLGMH